MGRATRIETQRAIWKNPRGSGYYYAIIQGGASGLLLYKSLRGCTWSLVSTLSTDTTMSVVSFSGSTYVMGTDTLIDRGFPTYHPFNAVADSNGVVHLVVHNAMAGSVGLRYF